MGVRTAERMTASSIVLSPLECCFAFLYECSHVFAREQQEEVFKFDLQTLFQWCFKSGKYGFFSQAYGEWWAFGNFLREFDSLVEVCSLRHDAIYQAMYLHRFGADLCPCQHHFHGAILAKGACQALSTSCSRNDAEQDLRLSKARIF